MNKVFLHTIQVFLIALFFGAGCFIAQAQVSASVLAPWSEPCEDFMGAAPCSYIRNPITVGAVNDMREVVFLQSFLQLFERIPVTITGEFDAQTVRAVKEFQKRYAKDILAPWGITEPTGDVSITTLHKINDIYCKTKGESLSLQEKAAMSAVLKKNSNINTATPTATSISNMLEDQKDRLGGTPIGFINEFSLPILIVLFLLLSVQTLFLWGFFPRLKRVSLIPHSFE